MRGRKGVLRLGGGGGCWRTCNHAPSSGAAGLQVPAQVCMEGGRYLHTDVSVLRV
jgi:hypothetical protein